MPVAIPIQSETVPHHPIRQHAARPDPIRNSHSRGEPQPRKRPTLNRRDRHAPVPGLLGNSFLALEEREARYPEVLFLAPRRAVFGGNERDETLALCEGGEEGGLGGGGEGGHGGAGGLARRRWKWQMANGK